VTPEVRKEVLELVDNWPREHWPFPHLSEVVVNLLSNYPLQQKLVVLDTLKTMFQDDTCSGLPARGSSISS
jgi:hypothetical protein